MVLWLSAADSIPVVHRIVTHNTGKGRDLYGMLRLSRVSGDATVVDLRYLGQPYALGSPIPVIESGHSGCGEHTWHDGATSFSLTPRKTGEVTLKAQVDPDPECCEGNGVSTVEARVTVTVEGEVTTLTGDPTSIPARSQWETTLPWAASQITVTWDPPECEGTLEIAEVVGDAGYVPPDERTVEPLEERLWLYRAFFEPRGELCPKDVTVSIAAMAGDQELDRETILVLPVHKWLTNGHQHGPGAQVHPPDTNDFWLDFDYLSWKYGGILGTTGVVFAGVTISTNTCARFSETRAAHAGTRMRRRRNPPT